MKPSSNTSAPTLADLDLALLRRGLTLSLRETADGTKIVLTGPKEQQTGKLLAYIRDHRDEVIAWLREDAAPRPDDYTGPVPEAVWEIERLGGEMGWGITARLDTETMWGWGVTKEAALVNFADSIASDPFPTPTQKAAFRACLAREEARLEAEDGTDAAPEVLPPVAATVPAWFGDEANPVLPGSAAHAFLLSWSGTTAKGLPPVAFVPDAALFWREYRAHRGTPAPYLDPTVEEVLAS